MAGLREYPNELYDGTDWPAVRKLSPRALEQAGTRKHIFTPIEWHMTALTGEVEGSDPSQSCVFFLNE